MLKCQLLLVLVITWLGLIKFKPQNYTPTNNILTHEVVDPTLKCGCPYKRQSQTYREVDKMIDQTSLYVTMVNTCSEVSLVKTSYTCEVVSCHYTVLCLQTPCSLQPYKAVCVEQQVQKPPRHTSQRSHSTEATPAHFIEKPLYRSHFSSLHTEATLQKLLQPLHTEATLQKLNFPRCISFETECRCCQII